MTDTSNRNRQSAGQPTGGQFATEARGTDTGVSLGGDEARARLMTLPPVDFDTEQYGVYERSLRAQAKAESALTSLGHLVETQQERRVYRRARLPRSEILARAEAAVADPATMAHTKNNIERGLTSVADTTAEANRLQDELGTYDDVFTERGGWNRAFLVTGSDGHVHSSMACSTCNRGGSTTRFQWMTNYSDHSEDEIVADAGWRACTVCYPSAPVGDPKTLPTKMFSAEEEQAEVDRAERAKAKTEREAAKAAKAATASGEPLVVRTGPPAADGRSWSVTEEFKTERTAVIWYTDSMTYGRNAAADAAREDIVAALAEKRGVDPGEVRNELEEKARKKVTKYGGTYTEPDMDTVTRNAEATRAAWAE